MADPVPLPTADAVLVGVGARAPCGLTALQIAMSVRALKMDPRPCHMVDKNGESIATARLPSIGDDVIGLDRFLALGGAALAQATYPFRSVQEQRRAGLPALPVFLSLPHEARPGFDPRLKHHLLPALAARAQVPFDLDRSRVVLHGRGGSVMAFELALDELRRGDRAAVVVGGVDSYFDPDVLDWLDQALRLHSLDTENGFIPGEGAAFVTLARRGRTDGLYRYGQVLSAASEHEPHPFGSDEPCLATGITRAVRRAVSPVGQRQRRIPWAITDVVEERHRVDEWAAAFARNHFAFTAEAVHDQPLLQTGDLGAASAAMMVAIAAARWQTGCAAGDCALVATHSDGPERGAMLIAKDTPG
ncbi:beta-ketoacyl synthase N-terminal-like domain-containing protein [Sorangium cellulosum]|uniref:Beta-ketoacyl synthase-like N-terminal domain-containing protein n=1 Tax=Sorangium cellulosum So0157-2 TaxID=1254432 RepID=S4XX25_SORCE|nr:beta-ketoacyl synthase N-terminal-like domain-containing protein [Sorangium cellulosum]AGP36435.1 hypothetical protein SCE1572_19235 [Sorangium cellulosum So0157-2]